MFLEYVYFSKKENNYKKLKIYKNKTNSIKEFR